MLYLVSSSNYPRWVAQPHAPIHAATISCPCCITQLEVRSHRHIIVLTSEKLQQKSITHDHTISFEVFIFSEISWIFLKTRPYHSRFRPSMAGGLLRCWALYCKCLLSSLMCSLPRPSWCFSCFGTWVAIGAPLLLHVQLVPKVRL